MPGKMMFAFVAVGVALFVSSCASRPKDSPRKSTDAIIGQLEKINVNFAAVGAAFVPVSEISTGGTNYDNIRKTDLALSKITPLPPNHTDAQVKRYLNDILAVVGPASTGVFSSMLNKMVMAVEPGHFAAVAEFVGKGNWAFNRAVSLLVLPSDREELIAFLPKNPHLISLVMFYGFFDAAKPVMQKALAEKNDVNFRQWRPAASLLVRDAADRQIAVRAVKQNPAAIFLLDELAKYKDIDVAAMAREAWNACQKKSPEMKKYVADYVIRCGVGEALDFMIAAIPDSAGKLSVYQYRFLQIIPAPEAGLTAAELKSIYRKNRDKVVFDAKTKKFVLQQKLIMSEIL